jgi:hypothetical protein
LHHVLLLRALRVLLVNEHGALNPHDREPLAWLAEQPGVVDPHTCALGLIQATIDTTSTNHPPQEVAMARAFCLLGGAGMDLEAPCPWSPNAGGHVGLHAGNPGIVPIRAMPRDWVTFPGALSLVCALHDSGSTRLWRSMCALLIDMMITHGAAWHDLQHSPCPPVTSQRLVEAHPRVRAARLGEVARQAGYLGSHLNRHLGDRAGDMEARAL